MGRTGWTTWIAATCAAWISVPLTAGLQQTPSEILTASYAKLHDVTYRLKRYAPDAADHPHVSDVVPPGLTRATVAAKVDGLGDVRFEEVSLGNRRGERIVAPSAGALLARARAVSTMTEMHRILNPALPGILATARAGYFGVGPLATSLDGIVGAVQRASDLATLRGHVDALDARLNHWVCGSNPPGSDISIELPTIDTELGPAQIRGVPATKYRREVRVTEGPPLATFVYIDRASARPIREEALDSRGQVTWVTEYMDFNAAITIDRPDCLDARKTSGHLDARVGLRRRDESR